MEVFDNLPQEKKERIINAAMDVFAAHGYRKASAADIAEAAGISKAMVFTYFGSKRGCYEYMCEEMIRVILDEFDKVKEDILAVTDYFERISFSAKIKVEALKRRPALLSFVTSVYMERDEQVRPAIDRVYAQAYRLRDLFLTEDIDSSKFRDPADAARVGKMLGWMSQGCADEWSRSDPDSLDGILACFNECTAVLKRRFYKEEYCDGCN